MCWWLRACSTAKRGYHAWDLYFANVKCRVASGWASQAHPVWFCHPWDNRWAWSHGKQDAIEYQSPTIFWQVVGLWASTSNTASTVLSLFLNSVVEYGCPSWVCGDRGRENINVAVWMIMHQGPKRGSFLWGSWVICVPPMLQLANLTVSSTHNTRIECLWLEVASQFTRRWQAFFGRLEKLHCLNRCNTSHLWLLQVLFLDLINVNCDAFKHDWNNHPMSTLRNQTPLVHVYLETCNISHWQARTYALSARHSMVK